MPWRNLFRTIGLCCGLAVLLWRVPYAIRDYRDWREAAVNDPSVAELYETNLWFEAGSATAALGLGLLIFYGLKRKEEPSVGLQGDSAPR